MAQFRFFQASEIDALYAGFLKAFSDYYVDFRPSPHQFRRRIFEKLHIAPEVSGLVWEKNEVVGFILHTTGRYQGLETAYNGGTGIIPEKRNQKLGLKLYQMLLPVLKRKGVQRILLEVITKNAQAIHFYEAIGFQYKRLLKCFKTYSAYPLYSPKDLGIREVRTLNAEYAVFREFEPLFLDHAGHLMHNLKNEVILEVISGDQLVGYLIFQPRLGRISQMGIHQEFRDHGVVNALLGHAQAVAEIKNLTFLNVPEEAADTINSLENLGFQNEVDQFEMELII